jgi:hypothetical protein
VGRFNSKRGQRSKRFKKKNYFQAKFLEFLDSLSKNRTYVKTMSWFDESKQSAILRNSQKHLNECFLAEILELKTIINSEILRRIVSMFCAFYFIFNQLHTEDLCENLYKQSLHSYLDMISLLDKASEAGNRTLAWVLIKKNTYFQA